jgi:hypothetical protein
MVTPCDLIDFELVIHDPKEAASRTFLKKAFEEEAKNCGGYLTLVEAGGLWTFLFAFDNEENAAAFAMAMLEMGVKVRYLGTRH